MTTAGTINAGNHTIQTTGSIKGGSLVLTPTPQTTLESSNKQKGQLVFDDTNQKFMGVISTTTGLSLGEISGGGGKTSVKIVSTGDNEKGMFIQEDQGGNTTPIRFYTNVDPDKAHLSVGESDYQQPDMEIQSDKIKIKNTLSVKDLVIQNPVSIAGTINLKNDQNTFANFADSFVNVKYEEDTSENTKNLTFKFDENAPHTNFMNIKDAYVKTRGINLTNASIPSGTIDPSLEGTLMYDSSERVFKGVTKDSAGALSVGQIAGSGGSSGTTETVTFPQKWDFNSIDVEHTANVYIYEEVYMTINDVYNDDNPPHEYGLVKLLNDSVYPGADPGKAYYASTTGINKTVTLTLKFYHSIKKINSIQFQQYQYNNATDQKTSTISEIKITLNNGTDSATLTKNINTPNQVTAYTVYELTTCTFSTQDNSTLFNNSNYDTIKIQFISNMDSENNLHRIFNFKLNYDRDIQKPLLRYPPAAWTSPATNSRTESTQLFGGHAYGNGLYEIKSSQILTWDLSASWGVNILFDHDFSGGNGFHLNADTSDESYFKIIFPKPICIKKVILVSREYDDPVIIQPNNITMYGDTSTVILPLFTPIDFATTTIGKTRTIVYDNDVFYTEYKWKLNDNTETYKVLGEFEIYGYETTNMTLNRITTNDLLIGEEDAPALQIKQGTITIPKLGYWDHDGGGDNWYGLKFTPWHNENIDDYNAVITVSKNLHLDTPKKSDGMYLNWYSDKAVNVKNDLGVGGNLLLNATSSGSSDVQEIKMQAKIAIRDAPNRVGFKQRIGFYDSLEYQNTSRLAGGIECEYGDNIHMPTYPGTNSTKLKFTVADRNHGVYTVAEMNYDGIKLENNKSITGTMAGNDLWSIGGIGENDSGALEIATRDNGNEAIYFKQIGSDTRTLTLLDGSGNTHFPGSVSMGSGKLHATALNVLSDSGDPWCRWNSAGHYGGRTAVYYGMTFNGAGLRVCSDWNYPPSSGYIQCTVLDTDTIEVKYIQVNNSTTNSWSIYTQDNLHGSSTKLVFSPYGGTYAYLPIETGGYVITTSFTGEHITVVKNINQNQDNVGLIVVASQNTYTGVSKYTKNNEAITISESVPDCELSFKKCDKHVFGVLRSVENSDFRDHSDVSLIKVDMNKEKGDVRYHVNGLGEGAIWVSDMNGPLESGDFITSSDLLGYGMKQDEEQMMNYTVAKITMDCDFEAELEPKLKIKKYTIMSNVEAFEEVEKVETKTVVEFDEILGLYLNKTSNYTVKEQVESFDEFPIHEYHVVPLYSNQIVGTSNVYSNVVVGTSNIYNNSNVVIGTSNVYSNQIVGTSNVYSNVVIGTSNMLVNTSNMHKVRRYSNVEIEENVLDSNGELIWEPELDSNGDMIMQPAYKMRYLNSNSDIITLDDYLEAKSNNIPVYRAAFVGCTYHCS